MLIDWPFKKDTDLSTLWRNKPYDERMKDIKSMTLNRFSFLNRK